MSVNLTNSCGRTPLHHSAKCGNLEVTKILSKVNFMKTKPIKIFYIPLLLAPRQGQLEVFHYLTKMIPYIVIRDVNRNSFLQFAAFSCSVEINIK